MSENHKLILSEEKIHRILDRIAVQIVENNLQHKNIALIGIIGQGHKMAGILKKKIEEGPWKVKCAVHKLEVDKKNPSLKEIKLDCTQEDLDGKSVILIDDVLNTGRTQAYSLRHILNADVMKVEIAVLVNRSHTAFPIAPTYSGIALSTTLDEHIEVRLEKKVGAYLY